MRMIAELTKEQTEILQVLQGAYSLARNFQWFCKMKTPVVTAPECPESELMSYVEQRELMLQELRSLMAKAVRMEDELADETKRQPEYRQEAQKLHEAIKTALKRGTMSDRRCYAILNDKEAQYEKQFFQIYKKISM